MHVRKILLDAPLTFCLAVLVLGYQLWNGCDRRFFDYRSWVSRDSIALQWGSWTSPRLPFAFQQSPPFTAAIDRASQAVRDAGYLLNYIAGRRPEFLFTRWRAPFLRLYLREEVPFQHARAAADVASRFGDSFHHFIDNLTRAGVHVVIVPVPTKISIERPWIGGALPAETLVQPEEGAGPEDARAVYSAAVKAAPGQTIDLLQTWQDYQKDHPDAFFYPPTNVNWSSLGLALAAQAAVAKLKEQGLPVTVPELVYENKMVPDYSPDILRALLLPEEFLQTAPEFRFFEPVYDLTDSVSSPDAAPRARLILAGSCNSRHLYDGSFGFGSLLARSLHRTPLEVALAANPATAPLREIAEQGWILYPGDVLVWEFGMRNLPRAQEEFPSLFVEKTASRDVAGKKNDR